MLTMVSKFVLDQTQTTPQDHFLQASKTYTKSSLANNIFLLKKQLKKLKNKKRNKKSQHHSLLKITSLNSY